MKKIFLIILLFLVSICSWAQIIFHEPFPYSPDPVIGLHNQSGGVWVRLNTGDSILVEAGSLSFPGLEASTGNKVKFDGGGADNYRSFNTQNSGTVYFSFLMNVPSLGSLGSTGGYFSSLVDGPTTSNFGASLWTRASAVTGKYNLGIAPRTTVSTISWLSLDLDPGTTYLIVASYELISGAGNDVVKLWVNPLSLGGSEPAANTSVTNTAGTDLASVGKILLRQDNATNTPFIEIDEIRVGTTYASVTPEAIVIADPTTTSISPSSAVAGSTGFSLTVNGTNFISGQSTVTWNGSPRTTTFVSATELSASISPADIASPGTANVGVTTTGAANPSNTQLFTITAPPTPLLAATSLAPFGNVCINTIEGPASFTITGTNLAAGDITVGPLAGYSFATSANGAYLPSLTISQGGGSFSQQVFVHFQPTAVQSYDGNIAIAGGSATTINVAASGTGINTLATVTAGTASAITASGATIPGSITATGCGSIVAYGAEYSITQGFTAGTGTQVAGSNLSGGSFSVGLNGLNAGTTYYYRTYAQNAAGTAYSTEQSFTTSGVAPVAPVATPATSITSGSFTANWNASSGATHYFLDVYTMGASVDTVAGWSMSVNNISALTADKGNSNNIGSKTLSASGVGTFTYPVGPTGTSGNYPYSVSAPGWDNGADVKFWQVEVNTTGMSNLTLSSLQGSSGTGPSAFKIQYSIGTSGTWVDVPGGTVNISTAVSAGNMTTFFGPADLPLPAAVNNQPSVLIRWLQTSNTNVNGTGNVASGGTSRIAGIYIKAPGTGTAPVYVSGYNNLNVGDVTSYNVTGLTPSTTYFYVVRAANTSGASANSNEIVVTTSSAPQPQITIAGTVADFGTVTSGQASAAQTFTVSGANLTGAPGDIILTAPADFQISLDGNNWSASVNIPYSSATLGATIVHVRFTPQSAGAKSGNISINGGGATATVAVSGTGALPAPPVAPVATAATGINFNSFTANWNAVNGATHYLLDVYTMTSGSTSGVIAGWNTSSNTASSQLADAGNANNAGIQSISGSGLGTISYPGGPAGGTGQPGSFSVSANGWDNGANTKFWQINVNTTGVTGLTLSSLQGSSNTGPANFKIQYRIGAAGTWTDVPGGTVNITVAPSPGNAATFFGPSDLPLPAALDNQPEVSIRWLMTSNTSVNGTTVASGGTSRIAMIYVKGSSTGSVPVYVAGYQNLNVGNVTSHTVTGLNPSTNYYYVVRAANAAGTSSNSNEIAVVTAADPNPFLTATALPAFGNVCINSSAAGTFTLSGNNLTSQDIEVGPLPGFSFSVSASGPFVNTLVLQQPGGSFSQQVFVRFEPTLVQSYSGNIPVTGGGTAAGLQVPVSGAGVNTAPAVTTGAANSIIHNAAVLPGNITNNGCSVASAYGIEYSTTNNFTTGSGIQVAGSNLTGGAFSVSLTGLNLNTTYYYRAWATNAGGTTYGSQQSFTTLAAPPVTLNASALAGFGNVCVNTGAGPNSFMLTGSNLTSANVVVGPLNGFAFSLTAGGTYTPSLSITQPGGNFSQQVFVRFTPTAAQSYNGNIPVSGGGATAFTVPVTAVGINTPPTVVSGNVSQVTTYSAVLGGSVSNAGCSNITEYGIEYSSIPGFTPGTGSRVAPAGGATGSYQVEVAGLVQGATYYFRAYAANAGATGYGEEKQFTLTAIPDAFTLYPVPVKKGEMLFFSANNLATGFHGIRIFNASGQEIFRKNYNVQNGFLNERIMLPQSIAPGIYRISLSSDTRAIETKTIVIM